MLYYLYYIYILLHLILSCELLAKMQTNLINSDQRINKQYVLNYIQQKRSADNLNLIIIRSIESQVEKMHWSKSVSILEEYKDSISVNYKDYNFSHIDKIINIMESNSADYNMVLYSDARIEWSNYWIFACNLFSIFCKYISSMEVHKRSL